METASNALGEAGKSPGFTSGPPVEEDPDRPSLSICILGQNTAHRMEPLLAQASWIANEIVYLDGGSEDDSEAVVARYRKARFISRPFDGHFARQRNYALDHAGSAWVLVLDTDELLGPRIIALLPTLLRSNAATIRFPRYWLVSDRRFIRARRVYPDRHLRLFRNKPELRYDEKQGVHEQLPPDRIEPCLRLRSAHLLHYCLIWQNRAQREQKARNYADIHPGAAEANAPYLYEDMPHRISRCREGWTGGRPWLRPDLSSALLDRVRIRRMSR